MTDAPLQPEHQDKLIAFVTNPETIKKAVEGSMDKRLQHMQPEQPESIDEILDRYCDPTYPIELDKAKAAIERLLHRSNLEAELRGLNKIPNFELVEEPGNAVDYIIKRTRDLQQQLTDLEK